MDAQATWTLLATGAVLALAGALGGIARTKAPLAWHAHLPWNGIAFGGVATALMAAVHLFTLLRGA
ncbi:hypothetical protein [Sandarakinorhabdus rubra]|uniref:hypothetical protein n=1 Tax=Sandarakinorhabdus rubra TaxID=2672568 RepID=UPI0013D9FF19|nr:hypothetical protein [Sandarakinorhabdus rubra]